MSPLFFRNGLGPFDSASIHPSGVVLLQMTTSSPILMEPHPSQQNPEADRSHDVLICTLFRLGSHLLNRHSMFGYPTGELGPFLPSITTFAFLQNRNNP